MIVLNMERIEHKFSKSWDWEGLRYLVEIAANSIKSDWNVYFDEDAAFTTLPRNQSRVQGYVLSRGNEELQIYATGSCMDNMMPEGSFFDSIEFLAFGKTPKEKEALKKYADTVIEALKKTEEDYKKHIEKVRKLFPPTVKVPETTEPPF